MYQKGKFKEKKNYKKIDTNHNEEQCQLSPASEMKCVITLLSDWSNKSICLLKRYGLNQLKPIQVRARGNTCERMLRA